MMNSDSPANPAALSPALFDALRSGENALAERILKSASVAPEQIKAAAEGLMRRRRYREAAWLLAQCSARDATTEMKLCLARNMAAMQAHHPDIYAQLIQLPATQAIGIVPSPSGPPTLFAQRADGSAIRLSGGEDPVEAAKTIRQQLAAATPNGEALALCGVGDGYVIQSLWQTPPALFMDMEQGVFVIESEPQILLHALMIHDWSEPNGPIASERFRWFIGPGWASRLDQATLEHPKIGVPTVMLQQGLDAVAIKSQLQLQIAQLGERDRALKAQVEAHYAALTPAAVAEAIGPNAQRKPRVLLLTTRFSTVLQYSTRDTAEAFESLGWEALVLIEPKPSHRLYQHTFRQALADFKPDLVFQIDHLRYEHSNLFPKQLPFVCWAQDHLPNLTVAAAGTSVGPTDFVLVGMPTMYVNRYGYPREQTLMLAKLTRIPERPANWKSDGADLVYVSSASALPADVAATLVEKFGGPSEVGQRFVETCCRRVIDHYAAGGTLPAMNDFAVIIRKVEQDLGQACTDPDVSRRLADALFDRLGNVLYRHQGLAWLADIAKRNGLTLAIYGHGWDKHPEFAPYACGPVKYGMQLEELTRRSKINFTLEPFFSISHQRLVDGLVAGGFFLVRHHPKNTLIQQFSNFLASRVPPSVASAAEARRLMSPEDQIGFDRLDEQFAPWAEFADTVAFVRTSEAARLVCPGEKEPLPGLASISFASPAELEARVLHFIRDAALRADVSSAQRRTMETRRSYVAGLGRIVSEIHARLAEVAVATEIDTQEPVASAA